MASGWSTVLIDDVPSHDGPGPADWKPLRHHLGIEAFGINAWVATEADQVLIQEHDEELEENAGGHEEVYVVTRGHATFAVDGESVEAPAGAVVHVADPRLVRSAVAREAGTTVLAIGSKRGGAFEPSRWELRRIEAA